MRFNAIKFILGLLFLLTTSGTAFGVAETSSADTMLTADNNVSNDDFGAPVPETENPDFFNADEQLGKTQNISAPTCSSPQLFTKIKERVWQYTDSFHSTTTLAKRSKSLILANLGGFSNVSVEDFNPEEDYNTANALIMIKLNEKIPEKDIILCRQNEAADVPLYVVLYPYADNYQGYIINLDKNSIDYKDISFIYP